LQRIWEVHRDWKGGEKGWFNYQKEWKEKKEGKGEAAEGLGI